MKEVKLDGVCGEANCCKKLQKFRITMDKNARGPRKCHKGEGAAMTTSAASRKRENVGTNMCKGENGSAVRKRDNAAHR